MNVQENMANTLPKTFREKLGGIHASMFFLLFFQSPKTCFFLHGGRMPCILGACQWQAQPPRAGGESIVGPGEVQASKVLLRVAFFGRNWLSKDCGGLAVSATRVENVFYIILLLSINLSYWNMDVFLKASRKKPEVFGRGPPGGPQNGRK